MATLLLPAYNASAVVIKSIDQPENNYEIHYKVTIYQNFTSYDNPDNQRLFNARGLINIRTPDEYSLTENDKYSKLLSQIKNDRLTGLSRNKSDPKSAYTTGFTLLTGTAPGEKLTGNSQNIITDSFLDDLKNDPSLRIIYFTSKDMIFSYKKKIVNVLQLGFNMDPNDYRNHRESWGDGLEEERVLKDEEKENLKRESGILFGLISQSYKNIFYVLLALGGALYICFRYFLNRYI